MRERERAERERESTRDRERQRECEKQRVRGRVISERDKIRVTEKAGGVRRGARENK